MNQKQVNVLLKPGWSVTDIEEYLNCSREYANQIKIATEAKYGCIPLDKGKKKTKVRADDVIKIVGGVDRLTELNLYKLSLDAYWNDLNRDI